MTYAKRNILLVFVVVVLVISLLVAPTIGDADTVTEKSFVQLSGLSSGYTRANSADGITDAAEISASAIYLTMPANDLPYNVTDGWSSAELRPVTSSKVVVLDGTNLASARLTKYGANSYYLNLKTEAKQGSRLVIDGVFYDDANGNKKQDSTESFVNISAAMFVYDGDVWSQVRPSFVVKYNGVAVDNLFVLPNTDISAITAECNGKIKATITYPQNAVNNGKFVLQQGKTRSTYTLVVSAVHEGVKFEQYVDLTVGYNSFVMKQGAAVGLFADGGLRFGATVSAAEYALLADGELGFAMVKRSDYDNIIADGEFTASKLLQCNALFAECEVSSSGSSGYTLIADFIGIPKADFTTEYVGIAFSRKGDSYVFADFYGGSVDNNTRSCYYVAQLCEESNDNAQKAVELYVAPTGGVKADLVVRTVVYGNGVPSSEVYSVTQYDVGSTVTVDAPQLSATLIGNACVEQKIYVNRNNEVVFEYVDGTVSSVGISAWFLPYLSEQNEYKNDRNFQIVAAMKAAGLNTVFINGDFTENITSENDMERIRQLIALFDSYDIGSYVDLKKQYFALGYYPDFSECSGFKGILQWDEPTAEIIDSVIANYAQQFDELYGNEAEFWCNLLPSEAVDGAFGTVDGVELTYSQYLERYCTSVLSKISGTKVLSVDSYPIYADYSIDEHFLTSIGLLKYYAVKYGAKANICLQSCGWNEGSTLKARMPSEAEMRLQAYAALAFGMDSFSWFTYSQFQSADKQTADMVPVDYQTGTTNDGYAALAKVNGEIAAFADVYAEFSWKGAIFNFGAFSAERDGYNSLKNTEFASYVLDEQATQFSNISVSGFGSSVITGVFDGTSDVMGYAFCNYASLDNGGKTATVVLKTSQPLTATIYRNGGSETVTISGQYTLTLGAGEGCFMVCEQA